MRLHLKALLKTLITFTISAVAVTLITIAHQQEIISAALVGYGILFGIAFGLIYSGNLADLRWKQRERERD